MYPARFKSFPVADDDHFLVVCRYVERNPLRANLVGRADDWQYGSLWRWAQTSEPPPRLLSPWPIARTPNWIERVYISEVDIEILGGFPAGTAEDSQRTIEENSTKYPENRMFGVLPAYAFYIRHARDIHVSDVRIAMRQEDARTAFVLDDVHDSTFENVFTESVSAVSSFRMLENCTGVKISPEH